MTAQERAMKLMMVDKQMQQIRSNHYKLPLDNYTNTIF